MTSPRADNALSDMADFDVDPEQDFHVVLGGQVMALSLDQLDAAFQADHVREDTLIWQPNFAEWMRLDVVLAELEKHHPIAPPPPLSDDVYFVLLAPGEVKQFSLDKLDDAYRLDIVSLDTLVWQEGYAEWIPLGLLLGDDVTGGYGSGHVSLAPSTAPAQPGWHAGAAPSSGRSLSPRTTALVDSLRPMEMVGPITAPSANPWFMRSLGVLSAAALLLVLHRNGVTDALAEEVGQEGQLRALAGAPTPSLADTPDGVKLWLGHVEATYGLSELSETEPVPEASPSAAARGDAESEAPAPSPVVATPASAPDKAAAQPEGVAPAATAHAASTGEAADVTPALNPAVAPAAPSKESAQALDFQARLSGESIAKAPAVPQRQRPTQKAKKANLPSTGNSYDPMNGAL